MGKKRCRSTYISKGQRSNVARDVLKATAREVSGFVRAAHLREAWRAGKNPWVTVKNPEKGSKFPYFRKRANEVWGNPKANRGVM